MFDTIVFDLDGTILNTLADIRNAVNYTLCCYGLKTASEDDIRHYVGSGLKNAIKSALADKGGLSLAEKETEKALLILISYYSKNAANLTEPYKGIESLLMKLVSRGIKVCVLTNKDESIAKALVMTFFPSVRFSFVRGKRPSSALKPDRALTLEVLSNIESKAERTIIVGDSDVDYMTALNAGAYPIIVSYGYKSEAELRKIGVKKTIKSVAELEKEIEKVAKVML
ncbi:MAG TPA: HAD family hydrolase [Candidatus Ornithospirochaeta avicola]|uniref:phosphoglycolate phosphatase n=1 Tax=Candidatus Ornithospirochaeta avicola TaxID=2840896 RepID=A0A9D1PVA3_9SPIO|nr:HAD family hydrolase [Candidatus Ornithospirochaeta avicola]